MEEKNQSENLYLVEYYKSLKEFADEVIKVRDSQIKLVEAIAPLIETIKEISYVGERMIKPHNENIITNSHAKDVLESSMWLGKQKDAEIRASNPDEPADEDLVSEPKEEEELGY